MSDQSTETVSELKAFFADLIGTPQAKHRGVDFIVWRTLSPKMLRRNDIYGGKHPDDMESFVIVDLPQSVPCDLRLDRRSPPVDRTDRLSSLFVWSATSDELVEKNISGALLDALVALAERYRDVTVTDDWVGFGPIDHPPPETAKDVDSVVSVALASGRVHDDESVDGWNTDGALPVRWQAGASSSVDLLPAGSIGWSTDSRGLGVSGAGAVDERAASSDLPFCYFCGAALTGPVSKCPECGHALEND